MRSRFQTNAKAMKPPRKKEPVVGTRYDPSRTGPIYRRWERELSRVFARLRLDIVDLVEKEDALGLGPHPLDSLQTTQDARLTNDPARAGGDPMVGNEEDLLSVENAILRDALGRFAHTAGGGVRRAGHLAFGFGKKGVEKAHEAVKTGVGKTVEAVKTGVEAGKAVAGKAQAVYEKERGHIEAGYRKATPQVLQRVLGAAYSAYKAVEHPLNVGFHHAQKAALAIAREKGLTPDKVERLGHVLGMVDGAMRLTANVPLAHLALHHLAHLGGPVGIGISKLAYFVPVGSLAYVAHATVTDPAAVIRAAREGVRSHLAPRPTEGGTPHSAQPGGSRAYKPSLEPLGNVFCATGEGGGVRPNCPRKAPSWVTVEHRVDADSGTIEVRAVHKLSGEKIGSLLIKPEHQGRRWTASHTYVPSAFQRMGIATEMYDAVERHFGVKFQPSADQTEDAEKFWRSRKRRQTPTVNLSADESRRIFEAVQAHGWDPWYEALLVAAADEIQGTGDRLRMLGGKTGMAIDLADRAYEEEQRPALNVFCPTGEGGGVDATCSPGGHSPQPSAIITVKNDLATRQHQKAVQQAVDGLPEPVKSLLYRHGVEVVASNRKRNESGIIGLDEEGEYKNNKVRVGEQTGANQRELAAEILRHEAGHAVDEKLSKGGKAWSLESQELKDAYSSDTSGMPKALAKKLADFIRLGDAGPTEVFAQSFASLTGETTTVSRKDFQKGFPASYAVVEKHLRNAGLLSPTTNADPGWRFRTDPEKIRLFGVWLRQTIGRRLRGATEDQLWQKFIEEGFKRGAGRAFDDTATLRREEYRRKAEEESQAQQVGVPPVGGASVSVVPGAGVADFYRGSREQFLRDSFAHPISRERLEYLVSRVYTDLDGVTEQMATSMQRILADGLVRGQSPREVASTLSSSLDLNKGRALTIARTELVRSQAEGQLTALENLGVDEVGVQVEWTVTKGLNGVPDNRVCALCRPLDGVVLKIAEARGMLPRHPSCRCAFMPAGLGESPMGQKRSKARILSAVKASRAAERRKGQTPAAAAAQEKGGQWGPGAPISKARPEPIVKPGKVVGNADLPPLPVTPAERDLSLLGSYLEAVEVLRNAFCPTGPGGGVKPDCSPGESRGHPSVESIVYAMMARFKKDKNPMDGGECGAVARALELSNPAFKPFALTTRDPGDPTGEGRGITHLMVSADGGKTFVDGRGQRPKAALLKMVDSKDKPEIVSVEYHVDNKSRAGGFYKAQGSPEEFDAGPHPIVTGLLKELTHNAFCPTGPHGGRDNSCSSHSDATSPSPVAPTVSPREKYAGQTVGASEHAHAAGVARDLAQKLGGVTEDQTADAGQKDKKPYDVKVPKADGSGDHDLEVKSLLKGAKQDISVHPDALLRKVRHQQANPDNTFHTVVRDERATYGGGAYAENYSGHHLYYKRGSGRYRLSQMHKVRDEAELKALLDTPMNQLPAAARGKLPPPPPLRKLKDQAGKAYADRATRDKARKERNREKLAEQARARRMSQKVQRAGATENAFCPTGPGGGVNPHCSPGGAPAPVGTQWVDDTGKGIAAYAQQRAAKAGLKFSDLYLKKLEVFNPTGVQSGTFVMVGQGSKAAQDKHLDFYKSILPPGTIIKSRDVSAAKLATMLPSGQTRQPAAPAVPTAPPSPHSHLPTVPYQTETSWTTGTAQPAVLNGIPFAPAPPKFWEKTKDVDIKEPPPVKPISRSSVIIKEKDGRVWIVEPTGHFGNRKHTLPGGTNEPHLTNQQNALKEVWEETGLQVKITGHLGDFEDSNNGRIGRTYIGERIGGEPWGAKVEASIRHPVTGQPAAESETVKLVTPERAAQLLHRTDDLAQLATVHPIDVNTKPTGNVVKKIVDGLQPAAKAHTNAKKAKGEHPGDATLNAIQELRGFNGKPTVVSKKDMDALIAQGNSIEMLRGLKGVGNLTAADLADQFKSGDHFPGYGCFGSGTYADSTKGASNVANTTYSGYGSGGAVVRMVIPKTAKIIDQSELEKKVGWSPPSNYQNSGHHASVDAWLGLQAALAGYDAIRVDGKSARHYTYGKGFYVILNRSIVTVQTEDAKGHMIS